MKPCPDKENLHPNKLRVRQGRRGGRHTAWRVCARVVAAEDFALRRVGVPRRRPVARRRLRRRQLRRSPRLLTGRRDGVARRIYSGRSARRRPHAA